MSIGAVPGGTFDFSREVQNFMIRFIIETIMQITRDNYSQYAQMVQQMFGKKASSNDPLAQC